MRIPSAAFLAFLAPALAASPASAQPFPIPPHSPSPVHSAWANPALLPAPADSVFAEERALYWLKCSNALRSRRQHVNSGLWGMGIFLVNAPLEYAISRERHLSKTEPVVLNAAAFALMGLSLFNLFRSWQYYEVYERDRACCRYWQEYAQAGK